MGPARAVTGVVEGGSSAALVPPAPALPSVVEEPIIDDRADISPGDSTLLIVEDDSHYARILLGLAREKGFRGIVASRGQTALSLAREFQPTAITLDVFLPDMLGWTVLNNLKMDPSTRHIPVQMLSSRRSGAMVCPTGRSRTSSSRRPPPKSSPRSTASRRM
jgi:hypothetical protein